VLPPGKIFDIAGFGMHICVRGRPSGLPPVVIEAGNSMCGAAYSRLQDVLASDAQVITYDRAGLGWSDDRPGPRDAEAVCSQLHALLETAGIVQPVVLVGHSIGGLFLRVYARRFPDEVAGAVFLDASHPRAGELLGGDQWIEDTREFYLAQKRDVETGRLHPSDQLLLNYFADLPEVQAQLRWAALQPLRYDVSVATLEAFHTSAAQAEASGSLGNRPVLSITAPALPDFEWQPRFDIAAFVAAKASLHKDLARLSTRGRHIVIEGAEHGTMAAIPGHASACASAILELARQAAT
jgi:pimeloyl-ACP methyl ester carboxylesterase